MSSVRVLPVVVAATASLLALKVAGMTSGEGWALRFSPSPAQASSLDPAYRPVASAAPYVLMAQAGLDALGSADAGDGDMDEILRALERRGDPFEALLQPRPPEEMDPVVTGSVPVAGKEPDEQDEPGSATVPEQVVPPASQREDRSDQLMRERMSSGERAVLERLQERREELDAQAKALEMRESLLQAAEKRIEARIRELEELESRFTRETEVEQAVDGNGGSRVRDLVVMYENMRPKDAAKIFDSLNMRVLTEVARQMNPRKLGDILAQMKPEAAQRLTVELAGHPLAANAVAAQPASLDALPRIQGRPAQP